jgi:hypothetical protein
MKREQKRDGMSDLHTSDCIEPGGSSRQIDTEGELTPGQITAFLRFRETREESEHISLTDEFRLTNEVCDYFAQPGLISDWVRLDDPAVKLKWVHRFGLEGMMCVVEVLVAQGELTAEYEAGEDGQPQRTGRFKFTPSRSSAAELLVGEDFTIPK